MIKSCITCSKMYDDARHLDGCPHREFEWRKVAKTKPGAFVAGWDVVIGRYLPEPPGLVALRYPYQGAQRAHTAFRDLAQELRVPFLGIECRRLFANLSLQLGALGITYLPKEFETRFREQVVLYRQLGWAKSYGEPRTYHASIAIENLTLGAHLDEIIADFWKFAHDVALASPTKPARWP